MRSLDIRLIPYVPSNIELKKTILCKEVIKVIAWIKQFISQVSHVIEMNVNNR